MEAFVAAVLLGLAKFDEFRSDVELDPPEVKARDAVNGLGSERDAVVGADDARKAELAKKAFENRLG